MKRLVVNKMKCSKSIPTGNYLFKVISGNIRTKYEICFQVNNKNTRTASLWCLSCLFQQISNIVLVTLFLFVVDFEQVNTVWNVIIFLYFFFYWSVNVQKWLRHVFVLLQSNFVDSYTFVYFEFVHIVNIQIITTTEIAKWPQFLTKVKFFSERNHNTSKDVIEKTGEDKKDLEKAT